MLQAYDLGKWFLGTILFGKRGLLVSIWLKKEKKKETASNNVV